MKVKKYGIEFDVIDTVSCHEICREMGIPFDAEATGNKRNDKLIREFNTKVLSLQKLKRDIRFYEEVNSICEPEFRAANDRQIDTFRQEFDAGIKDCYKITTKLGWTTKK